MELSELARFPSSGPAQTIVDGLLASVQATGNHPLQAVKVTQVVEGMSRLIKNLVLIEFFGDVIDRPLHRPLEFYLHRKVEPVPALNCSKALKVEPQAGRA